MSENYKTHIIKSSDLTYLNLSKSLLEDGEVIAFPTETVYGLGADIFNNEAIIKIFDAKNRGNNNPLAAHIGNLNQVEGLWEFIPDDFIKLAEAFLPGPISIIYKKASKISDIITSGMDTLAIRYPDNQTCIDLISNYGKPLAATSANLSGKPSPVNAENVIEDLFGRIPLIIDDGNVTYGMESTVISLATEKPTIFRQGIISAEEIESVLNKDVILIDQSQKKQYAPNSKIYEFFSENELYSFLEKNFLTNFVILSDLDLKDLSFKSIKNETLFNEFRNADKLKADALFIVYNNKFDYRLIKEKVKLAINQQNRV